MIEIKKTIICIIFNKNIETVLKGSNQQQIVTCLVISPRRFTHLSQMKLFIDDCNQLQIALLGK